jgi:hypothetical protein
MIKVDPQFTNPAMDPHIPFNSFGNISPIIADGMWSEPKEKEIK